jgi:hypothetical protein
MLKVKYVKALIVKALPAAGRFTFSPRKGIG